MGDERLQLRDAAAETGRGRDPHAGGPAPAPAASEEVGESDGGRDPKGTEAAAQDQAPYGGGLGAGTEAQADTGDTAAAPAQAGQERLSLDDLEFHALRAIRYHEDRGSFLDLMRRCLDFGVVALGTTAVASLFADKSAGAVALNVATALIGAVQLVANLGDKAQEHRWARKKFCDLLARVTEAKQEADVTPRTMRKLTKRWTEIWGDEPTTMHVLEAVAWNATVRALNRDVDREDLIKIPPFESWTRNWLAHEGFEHLTRRERREALRAEAEAKAE